MGTTSPLWAQTRAFHVHQAPTAHILALGHPGPAQHIPIAKLVRVGASVPHPYSLTIYPSSFTDLFQTQSMPTCNRTLVSVSSLLPLCPCWHPLSFPISLPDFSSSAALMLYLCVYVHKIYKVINPGLQEIHRHHHVEKAGSDICESTVPVHQDSQDRVSTLRTRAMARVRRWHAWELAPHTVGESSTQM